MLYIFISLAPTSIASDRGGILGRSAPKLWANEWYGLDIDIDGEYDLESERGRVVYLLFFQSWCPGCVNRAIPSMRALVDHYQGSNDVVFIAVQTVFEGFHTNDTRAAEDTMARHGLDVTIGHDAGPDQSGSVTMKRYRSRGTPWTVVIDRKGIVRFNAFHLQTDSAVSLIDELLRP